MEFYKIGKSKEKSIDYFYADESLQFEVEVEEVNVDEIIMRKVPIQDVTPSKVATENKELSNSYWKNEFSISSDDQVFYRTSTVPANLSQNAPGISAALLYAYNNHGDIILSPDDIWIAIMQGLSTHINYKSEELRKLFVDHDGQKTLTVSGSPDIFKADWKSIMKAFTMQLSTEVKEEYVKNVICDFSTTTNIEYEISMISIMCSMKKYFRYMVCGCGIRNVYFMGTLDDWLSIQEKIKYISQFGLEDWCNKLMFVISNFILAYQGKVNLDFWNKIVDSVDGTGASGMRTAKSDISGWLLAFFPYNRYGYNITTKTKIKNLPNMHFKVPLIYAALDKNYDVQFLSGFSGVYYKDNMYRPQLSYLITQNVDISDETPKYEY